MGGLFRVTAWSCHTFFSLSLVIEFEVVVFRFLKEWEKNEAV